MAKLKTKNIDLSPECIEFHTIEAVKKKTVFKLHVQEILENLAKKKNKTLNNKKHYENNYRNYRNCK